MRSLLFFILLQLSFLATSSAYAGIAYITCGDSGYRNAVPVGPAVEMMPAPGYQAGCSSGVPNDREDLIATERVSSFGSCHYCRY